MNKRVTQAVILAGGLGTRLKPFTNTNPKPMYPINNVPFIDYLIRQMKNFGMEEVLLLLGYLPEKIMDYLGDGSRYGLTINYNITPVDYDTGMRIKYAAPQIADTFFLLYCDNYCPINYLKLFSDFCNNKAKIQITVYSNRDNYTKNNLHITDDGLVTTYDKKRIRSNLQGIAPEEVRLLKNINGNDIVFNMFGDVHQHIENTKGIDKWSELSDIIDFDFYEMQENYRNSSQVTEYCNKVFNMKMKAINTAGKGVHKLNTEEEFKDSIVTQLLDEQRTGLAAILIGDDEEAKYILDIFAEYKEKFNDMTDGNSTLHHTRWNIMNIDDAKGLEFSSVISFTGRMSKNEKYIAYTRALDELFVYPVIVEINKYNKQQYLSKKIKSEIKNNIAEKTKHTASKIESDFSISDVRNFFKKNGLKVVDNRNVNGRLWVVGEKLEIRNIVNEAITKFGISGKYASSKEIKNRTGWFTKTKK